MHDLFINRRDPIARVQADYNRHCRQCRTDCMLNNTCPVFFWSDRALSLTDWHSSLSNNIHFAVLCVNNTCPVFFWSDRALSLTDWHSTLSNNIHFAVLCVL